MLVPLYTGNKILCLMSYVLLYSVHSNTSTPTFPTTTSDISWHRHTHSQMVIIRGSFSDDYVVLTSYVAKIMQYLS